MEDLSYMRTEYARQKMVESYDIEAREKCHKCEFKRRMMSSYPGKKLPGIGKCIRPGGVCEEYKNKMEAV